MWEDHMGDRLILSLLKLENQPVPFLFQNHTRTSNRRSKTLDLRRLNIDQSQLFVLE
jgi:hypothetical protein